MKLSAELFAACAASMNGNGPLPFGHERRRAARIEVNASVAVELVSSQGGVTGAPPMTGEVKDFSPRGANIILPVAIASGRQFVIKLPRGDGSVIAMLCTAMHVARTSEGACRVGAEFTCVLREDATDGSASPPPPDGGYNHNNALRAKLKRAVLD